jgi:hypothetical protein
MSYNVQVLDMGNFLVKSRKFMKVGGKEAEGMNLRRNVS